MSTFNSLMQQNACYRNIKWTFAGLLPWYCYAIKTNSRKIHSRLSQPASAETWVNCKPITAWHYNCEPDSCAVWASYWQKNCHWRIKSFNGNLRCRHQIFRKYLVLNPNLQGGKRAFAHPANAQAIIDSFMSGSTNKASSSNEPKKDFWLIVSTS